MSQKTPEIPAAIMGALQAYQVDAAWVLDFSESAEDTGEACCLSQLVALVCSALASCLAFIQSFWADPHPELTQVTRFVEEWRQPAAADEVPQEVRARWINEYNALPRKAQRAAEREFYQNRDVTRLVGKRALADIEGMCATMVPILKRQMASVLASQDPMQAMQEKMRTAQTQIEEEQAKLIAESPDHQFLQGQAGLLQRVDEVVQQPPQAQMTAAALARARTLGMSFDDPSQIIHQVARYMRQLLLTREAIRCQPRSGVILNALDAWRQTEQQA